MSELKAPGKSSAISKLEVWEAWEKVKASGEAPGEDGCSAGDFETDLQCRLLTVASLHARNAATFAHAPRQMLSRLSKRPPRDLTGALHAGSVRPGTWYWPLRSRGPSL